MRHWIAAFVVALLSSIGWVAGPVGIVVAALTFFVSLFLLWAHEIGFYGAWTRFGLDRLVKPVLSSEHRQRFLPIFSNLEVLLKALTVAVVSIAFLLSLPASEFFGATLLVAGFAILEIHHANKLRSEPAKAATNILLLCLTNASITPLGTRRTKIRPVLVSVTCRLKLMRN